ncbi:MAG: hypothetical protein ACYC96_04905 [Fimbriimonadaceae bacterium]
MALFVLQVLSTDVGTVPPIRPGMISVEALMRLPKVGPRERAELAMLSDTILDDTSEYGHRQLVTLTAMTGETVRCDLFPDCLRVRFSVMDADVASVVPMLSNIVFGAELHADAVKASADDLMFKRRDYWSSALEPEVLPYRRANIDDTVTLYKEVGRPENLVVTFSASPPTAVSLVEQWRTAVAAKRSSRSVAFPPDDTTPHALTRRRGKLTTVLLRGRAIDPRGKEFATNLLAMFALGGGKDSAVWKALRVGLGWSYRQEAILRNSPDGLEPDVEVVTERSDADIARSVAVRPALENAIAAWTEADRLHALSAAGALFERGIGVDPLYFKGTQPALGDPLFMESYWRMKTGEHWRPQALLAAMGNVSAPAMQAAAKEIIDDANVEVIRGTG